MRSLNMKRVTLKNANVANLLNKRYQANCEKFRKSLENFEQIIETKTYLSNNEIACTKYNYALDASVQNFSCFEAVIRLSPDHQTLEIFNIKPIIKQKYVLEADPVELEKMRIKE